MDDLTRFGLVNERPSYRQIQLQYGNMSTGMRVQSLTALGTQFVRFIEDPLVKS